MKIKILFFASLKEALQKDFIYLDLVPPLTGRELKSLLIKEFPEIEKKIDLCRIACNCEFIEENQELPLQENLEVALIPPVSGG
ncbi:MAG: MoaD/ThiS family protein [Planctomycetota bacterium]|nr:MAG: MoaD/ThiS family protein [Planctomycetota bacterium]